MSQTLDEALLVDIERYATDIVRQAGGILAGYFGGTLKIEYKDKKERDPVTNADTEVQKFLAERITERFPQHGLLAEEDQGEREGTLAPDILWVVDPLDGTKNFLNGLPVYASSIGVMHRGVAVVGAVFIPWPAASGGAVLHARKGGGAFMEDQPISVLDSNEPRGNALVTLPGSFGFSHRFAKPMRGKIGEVRLTGSMAYEIALTAMGVLQYSVVTFPKLWDVAGGAALVVEAGGLIMRERRRTAGLSGMLGDRGWEPAACLVPSWNTKPPTELGLRRWSQPLALGGPNAVRYVTANLRRRSSLRRRLTRAARRVGRR